MYIMGPSYKGTPLCSIVAMKIFQMSGEDCYYISDRKEVKDHGDGGGFVGNFANGAKDFDSQDVVVIDDVITSGGSIGGARKLVVDFNGVVDRVLVLFDRQETAKGSEQSAVQMVEDEYGIPVVAASHLGDLITVLRGITFGELDAEGIMTPQEAKKAMVDVLAYNKEYGVYQYI